MNFFDDKNLTLMKIEFFVFMNHLNTFNYTTIV